MGMYTAYRCKAKIKPEYRGLVQGLIYWNADRGQNHLEGIAGRLSESYPVVKEFASCDRAQWFLGCWMWGKSFKDWAQGEHPLSFNDDLVLEFEGCIKNYDSEVQKFAKLLDQIAEKIVYCRMWYEEDYGPSNYLGNGEWEHIEEPNDRYAPWYYNDNFEEN
jgi:hypothetical protein